MQVMPNGETTGNIKTEKCQRSARPKETFCPLLMFEQSGISIYIIGI
jgi:hypothetical protein